LAFNGLIRLEGGANSLLLHSETLKTQCLVIMYRNVFVDDILLLHKYYLNINTALQSKIRWVCRRHSVSEQSINVQHKNSLRDHVSTYSKNTKTSDVEEVIEFLLCTVNTHKDIV
jgi:hypothetical protein